MEALIQSYCRFIRARFRVRALVGLLALTALIQIKELLDIVWAHFHINRFIADIMVQAACAPFATILIAPMFSFLAPLIHGRQSFKARRLDDGELFDQGLFDGAWSRSEATDSEADWYTDPSYSWFSGNIFHDD